MSNKPKYKVKNHIWNSRYKICHWLYCPGCGLVALKNEATRKRMAKPCESMENN